MTECFVVKGKENKEKLTRLQKIAVIFRPEAQLATTIRNNILMGKHDSQLPNRARLSASLGVTPIRLQNAFKILHEEGLIVTRPRKGTFVNTEAVERLQSGIYEIDRLP